MSNEIVKVAGREGDCSTDNAMHFKPVGTQEYMFLPYSQIKKIERYPTGEVVIHIPEWLAEKERL